MHSPWGEPVYNKGPEFKLNAIDRKDSFARVRRRR